ncbi:NACHT domain-containing protein [Dendronalium sp. ChiSLP03b]|uniref:NACHT N-terminal Helical domain 1-containing protein n=1 Tax=Dendronalium sp. ChiSLP03b TaxID=3075381 RepID=UPI002AD38FB2|nr:NACHT domain-containing protein [Dendronalium sp. ChiSLP03b]MDZ8208968.1 NACHT domain-containing protein [Dendronalium sp. ChiSLP03b]
MPVVRSLLSILCPAIAKIIISTYLKNRSLEKAVEENIVDKLKNFISNASDQEKTQRSIERIAKQIVEKMQFIFDLEAVSISQDSRTAVQFEIAETLHRAEVTSELLMSFSLDVKSLTVNLRNGYPEACKHFNRNETALYERILEEVSRGIIEVAPQLKDFTLAATTESLQRLEEIIKYLQTSQEQSQRNKNEFERRYRDVIIRELDRMEMFGLPRMDTLTARQSLSKAYVTLSAIPHRREEQNQEAEIISRKLTEEIAVHAQQHDKITSLRTSPVDETLANCRRIVIRGGAGAGKSTLLQWLAVRAAKQDFPTALESWNRLIPFFIRLRSLVDKGFPTPEEFPKLIARNIADTMPKGWVHQCLEAGYALVLIDGVDELPRNQRQDFFDALTRLVADFPYARYVVTSRPAGLKDGQGEKWQDWENWTEQAEFLNLSLQPMSPTDIEQFITQWHEALAAACRPEDGQINLQSKTTDLKRLLRQRPELRRLATTPLLCAMICALYRDRGENLPTERIKLYQECIDMLLNSRDRGRKIKLDLDESYPRGLSDSQKMALIQSFAYWMMQNNFSDVEIDRVDDHFTRRLPGMNLPKEVTGKQIRALFVERAALLREPAVGKIDFAHRTFQEFLAAQAALNEDSVNVLLQNAQNDQWREAIIVAAGLGRPRERKELLERLLKMGNETPDNRHYLHLLAVACLETTVEVDPQIRAEVLKQAEALLPPKDDDEVTMVARAGDAIAPLLAPNPNYSWWETARCVEALAKIGTSAAMEILADYAKDSRYDLSRELGEAWDAFDRRTYASKVLSYTTKVYVRILVSWDGFEYLSHVTDIVIANLTIQDLSPLRNFTNLTELAIYSANDIVFDFSPFATLPKLTRLFLGEKVAIDLSLLPTLPNLTHLFLNKKVAIDLSLLPTLPNLTYLSLDVEVVTDFSSLAALPNLTHLNLSLKNTDISSLAALPKLTVLELSGAINDLSALTIQPNLSSLFLFFTSVGELKPLTNLTNLVKLVIIHNNEEVPLNFGSLAKLSNLNTLGISGTKLRDLSLISNLTNLVNLSLNEDISDLSPLSNLTKLTSLSIGGIYFENCSSTGGWNSLSDLSPLANLINLLELRLEGTQVNDLSPLASLHHLTNLVLVSNQISDFSILSSFTHLVHLSIAETSLTDLNPLARLHNLRSLSLGKIKHPLSGSSRIMHTPVHDLSPLANLPNLTELVLGDTDVTDLSPVERLPNLKIENDRGW